MLAGLVLLATASGCTDPTSRPEPGTSPTSPSASASPSVNPEWDLSRPGNARKAVAQLAAAAGTAKVIKVDVSQASASLSAVGEGDRVVAWTWEKGAVVPSESDIEFVGQTAFDPTTYELANLDEMFATAAEISGSSSNQQLQIVEYTKGQVLMTVTTRPESMPVFFRKNGSAIHQLDFDTAVGFAEAIGDVTMDTPRVLAIGWSRTGGLWADVASAEKGVAQRTTRQAKVPAWTANRKATPTGVTFPVTALEPTTLARLVRELPQRQGDPGADVSFIIQRSTVSALPVITWKVGGATVVTTLSGTDITDLTGD